MNICNKYSYHKVTQLSKVNNELAAHVSNTIGFLSKTYMFCKLSWIGLFATPSAFLKNDNYDLQEVFL
jgi:hypothetical protein